MGTEIAKPTVLTDEAQAVILRAMAAGSYLSVACEAAGISVDTFDYWRKLVDAGHPNASRFADFYGAIKRASSIAEIEAIHTLKQGYMGWQAKAWFLERRFPKRWGKRDVVKPPEPPTKKVTIEFELVETTTVQTDDT